MGEASLGELLGIWVEGWASTRRYPVRDVGAFKAVELTDKTGDWEAFAVHPTAREFADLASFVTESQPRIVTILTDDVAAYRALAQEHGLIELGADQELMIMDFEGKDVEAPWLNDDELKLTTEYEDHSATVTVRTTDGVLAAQGHVAVTQGYAVFDRIITEPAFRRRGLGSFVMRALTAAMSEHRLDQGLLIASVDGQHLYHHLGWSDVSAVVIFANPGASKGASLSD
ncbi:GNAT family N-acetyltransferase [Sinomonas sp. ASV486]|uniref:GNAT family N-acetyltransferase n=1 Tax=Sinomonas puerhi TaxID=3238584 RepID=A0AB39L154_9MICC|nr:GNAT family N-acetyltransferase [Sinomonas sp. ASV486]MDQ4492097.1 GNAT family N-acetyltransferase [Sinomonas sp. ASV486]